METFTKIPVTLTDRLEFGEDWRMPATWEEFLDLLEECEFQIQYDEGEIFSTMGYASELHEFLATRMGGLLDFLLTASPYRVFGSNLALHIPGFVRRHYNADCSVVKGSSEEVTLRGNMKAVANPILLVEVLSPSSRDFDLGRKFGNYKKVPSLQQVVFVECTEQKVVNCLRQNNWEPTVYEKDADLVPVLDQGSLKVSDIYRKVDFEQS